MSHRRSALAFVLVRLPIAGRDYLLLGRHFKWGDWSLVGGHVEAGEDWLAAAIREANEELSPLKTSVDMQIHPLNGPIEWGPVPSRSASGRETVYAAHYYWLEFLRDPGNAMRRLDPAEWILVALARLTPMHWDSDISDSLARLADRLPGGLPAVPRAWLNDLADSAVTLPMRQPLDGDDQERKGVMRRHGT
jgi:ADP-ribose pyrophosphatase YjhB (NUDIX family)